MRRFGRAFKAAWSGIVSTWQEEANFRIETVLGLLALGLSLWLKTAFAEVLFWVALVLSLELLNSALEAFIDRLAPEPHPLVKKAKDAAAGAVLLASLMALLFALAVLLPPLLQKLGL
jgi:diacylglycerol kinase (ATP)